MPQASYAQNSFLGGEVSQFFQGRWDRPDWRTFLNVCLNAFPIESGAWVRRPGTRHAGPTRNGNPGRLIKFDYNQAVPYTLEFTDNFLRVWNGAQLNYLQQIGVASISTANPAVIVLVTPTGTWSTGDQIQFNGLGASCPLLQKRLFTITKIDTSHFALADAMTGANIDGSTLGVAGLAAGAVASQVVNAATPYGAGTWGALRLVQGENNNLPFGVILHPALPPYILTANQTPQPPITPFTGFTVASLLDGPYLDPFTNGVQANPNQLTGVVTITLSFPPYVATTSYPVGAFVISSSVNYVSIIDQNVGNTPASSPSAWTPISSGAAINNGRGFLGTDIGRLVRFYSEPAAWAVGTTYSSGTVVSYNPTGFPGAETFWQSLIGGNIGNPPGVDLVHWEPMTAGAALWTWGKIVSLGNMISQTLASSVNIGTLTGNGGVAASFDSTPSKVAASCSALAQNAATIDGYIGKDYHSASAQKIEHGTLYPSTDFGFAAFGTTGRGDPNVITSITVNMRAKASAPASAADGTLLGTTGAVPNTVQPLTIASNDQSTAWNYVWFEIIAAFAVAESANTIYSSQAEFFNPPGTGSGNAINVELLGPSLLYTTPINNWRLGAYSNSTGWPTCGTYTDGRLWLSGAIDNRVDGCVSNGISGNNVNFAPTDQNGVVSAANGIAITINTDSVNPVFNLMPDQQGIVTATQSGEHLIYAPTTGPLAPNNIAVRKVTSSGTANVEWRHTEHTKVAVQRHGRKIIEFFPDVFSGKFTAPNLAEKAMHLTRNGVLELAYQQAVTPILWMRDAIGKLFGITYKRDTLMTSQGPTFVGWHRHSLGSGRIIESIAAGPSTGGTLDSISMITNDPTTGVRHVEILTDVLDEQATLPQAWYLDDAINPTSASFSNTPVAGAPYGGLTLNGLWHLNDKTVQVWSIGLDCGLQEGGKIVDFVVTNGSVFIPFGDGVSAGPGGGLFTETAAMAATLPSVVGFTYNSDAQLVRPMTPQESGARTGPALGKKRRTMQYALLLNNAGVGLGTLAAAGLLVGTSFAKLFPALFKQFIGGPNLPSNATFSGVHWDTLGGSESDFDNMFCWRVTRPYPCNVVAAELFLDTADK